MVAANPLIEVAPGLMIWTLICFGITFYVLKRFAFGPVQKIIDERRQRVREAIEEAERARAEARRLLEEHKELRASARGEAEEILAEARREIDAETARALEAIRAEVADLALIAAEKATAGALDDGAHRRLIQDAVKELDFSALEARQN